MEQKRTRRTFDPSFKHHAALRVVEGKEKAAAVAADLGINIVSLYNWVKDYEKTKATAIANAQSQATQAAETAPTTQTPVETSSPIESPAAEAPRRPNLPFRKPVRLRKSKIPRLKRPFLIPNFLQTTADAKTSSNATKETAETLSSKERCAAEMQVRMKRPCTTRLFRAP